MLYWLLRFWRGLAKIRADTTQDADRLWGSNAQACEGQSLVPVVSTIRLRPNFTAQAISSTQLDAQGYLSEQEGTRYPTSTECVHPDQGTFNEGQSLTVAELDQSREAQRGLPEISSPSPGEVYVDQLIEGVQEEFFELEEEELLKGRRFFSNELIYYSDDAIGFGTRREQGTRTRWRRETAEYGDLDLEGIYRDFDAARFDLENDSRKAQFSIRQRGFVVSDYRQMDNFGGVERTITDSLISSSFRFRLPSSLINGWSGRLYSQYDRFSFTYGHTGERQGVALQEFDSTGGDLSGIGYTAKVNKNWTIATQFYSLRDHDFFENHENLASVFQYVSDNKIKQYQLHILNDSNGQYGAWLDGEYDISHWKHRYGVFRLEPDLRWTDASFSNDIEGVYWRSDVRAFRYSFTLGYDWDRNNIDSEPTLPGFRRQSLFMTGNYRLGINTNLGGTINLIDRDPDSGTAIESSNTDSVTVRVSQKWRLGTSRVELSKVDFSSDSGDEDTKRIEVDHDWRLNRRFQLLTSLAVERSDAMDRDFDRYETGIIFRHDVNERFNWSATFTDTKVEEDGSTTTDTRNLTLAMNWQISKYWNLDVNATFTDLENRDPVIAQIANAFGIPVDGNETTLLVKLRYARSKGSPLTPVGRVRAKLGYGQILGIVFLDENEDGIRQPSERLVTGLTIFLDRSFPTLTDASGGFIYAPVSVGEHEISLALEDLPLPWGLQDESPRVVDVARSGIAEILIPLVKLQ